MVLSFFTARGGGRLGCVLIILSLLITLQSFAADISLEAIIQNLENRHAKILDLQADTTTTIRGQLMGDRGQRERGREERGQGGKQEMVQKGKIWQKGRDKSRIEMTSPTKQITINNGNRMAIVDPETGRKVVREKGDRGQQNRGQEEMSLEKAKEYFNLRVQGIGDSERGDGEKGDRRQYVIIGVPKKSNQFLGKMEFYVDGEKWVPTKIIMYDGKGKAISETEMEYQRERRPVKAHEGNEGIGREEDIYVPKKNKSTVSTPMGKMEVEMEYSNIKVNQGIDDKEFAINE